MTPRSPILLLALLAACGDVNLGDPRTEYYPSDATAPAISALSPASEVGNGGGQTITITGSGFGTTRNAVTVVIGNRNADVVAATDSALTVVVPHGPFEGGAVDVRVGTPSGQAVSRGGYTYTVSSLTEDETAYVMATNAFFSCYGGTGNNANDQCTTSAYIGYSGIAGTAAILDLVYPRFHTADLGFWGGGDTSGDWLVETPDVAAFVEGITSFYRDDVIKNFTLKNPALANDTWCVDYGTLATYLYAGGTEGDTTYDAQSLSPGDLLADSPGLDVPAEECAGGGQVLVPLDTLQYCRPSTYGTAGPTTSTSYQADWPIAADFFSVPDPDSGELDGETPVVVDLDVPEAGISGVQLDLPEPARFQGTMGFASSSSGSSKMRTLWGISTLAPCTDSDGDGQITLADTALQWTWKPSVETDADRLAAMATANGEGVVQDVHTTVKVSLAYLNLGWLGGEGTVMRASIEVPDEDGVVNMPNSVFYQFPNLSGEGATGGFTGFTYGDPLVNSYGILVATTDRVTEYRMHSDVLGHDVVFAYDVSDFGFFDYTNPLDTGACD